MEPVRVRQDGQALSVKNRVLKASLGWTVRRSVCVSMVEAVTTSLGFAPVPLDGLAPSATKPALLVSMAKGVTKPAVAVTMASVIQPAVSVCVHQAGLDPTVQQNALQGFMGLTVTSAACARTVPPVTRAMEYAHVPVAGQVQPVNSSV